MIWGRFRFLLPCLGLALSVADGAGAQTSRFSPFSFEATVGAAVPLGDFGNVDAGCPAGSTGCDFPLQIGAEPGWRWEGRLHVDFRGPVRLIVGYGQARFGCSSTFCGREARPGSRAVSVGVEGTLARFGRMRIWGDGGAQLETVSVVRTRDQAGVSAPKAVWFPWAPGVHGAVGVELPFSQEGSFLFSPGFRFHRTKLDPPDDHPDMTGISATYFLAELGFRFLMGGT